ncbi:MAG: hypothetical protein QOD75_2030 [Blastocatellia bacterium]|jgi:hypothetical protein|nr:hypothetical protein [Blastocatellia bacterium]
MYCLTLAQLIALETAIVALLTYLTSMFIPEVRRFLHLEPAIATSTIAEVVFKALASLLILLGAFFLFWFLWCHTSISRAAQPPPISGPGVGPIVEGPSVDVDGARFTLYTFMKGYHWRYGAVEAQFNQRTIPEQEMINYLAQLKETISLGEALICIGTASQDVQKDEPFEEQRAGTRATQLALWVNPAVSKANQLRPPDQPVQVYLLNLGHYREVPDNDDQRMIVFVRVRKLDPNVSIDELLSPANREDLKRKLKEKEFPFSFDSYSLFELVKNT